MRELMDQHSVSDWIFYFFLSVVSMVAECGQVIRKGMRGDSPLRRALHTSYGNQK